MTLQEIINILKSYAITTRISWDVVKYDADKAIYKINDYMGTCYPKMSDVLMSPEHSYSFMCGNKSIPIIPDRYIVSIVIPYIASEILAREEEFTTIYNKYIMEVEDGLFTMFQNEFNNVPIMFRQQVGTGVFFENQQSYPQPHINTYGFHVYYHTNLNEDNKYIQSFNLDHRTYTYKDTVTIQPVGQSVVINSDLGYYCYIFKGWTRDPRVVTSSDLLQEGDTIDAPLMDIHLYAVWDKQLTIDVINNSVYIKEDYKDLITNLRIPAIINGTPIKTIPTGFSLDVPNLTSVILPKTLERIKNKAFVGYNGTVQFPTVSTSGISIESDAFTVSCNIPNIYLPITIISIDTGAFMCTTTFYCEFTEGNEPDDWLNGWCTEDSEINWGVSNG